MSRQWLIPVLAVMLALVTTIAIVTYLQSLRRQVTTAPSVPMAAVLVAKQDIAGRQFIKPEWLEVRQIPVTAVHPKALHSVNEAVNQVAVTPIFAGQQILAEMVAPAGVALGLSYVVPEGKRAVTLAVNEVVDVAGFVSPGDRVDVVGTVSESGTGSISHIFLQNILVLAAAQQPEQKPGQPPKVTTSVTLALTPEQAEALTQIDSNGRVRLALRPAGSTQTVETKGQTTVSALAALGVPAPAAASAPAQQSAPARPAAVAVPVQPSGYPVEIWRATQKQTIQF